MECYSHPGAAAAATCIACEKPICAECREELAGHAMCHACVAATQARLSADTAPTASETPAAAAAAVQADGQPVVPPVPTLAAAGAPATAATPMPTLIEPPAPAAAPAVSVSQPP